MLYSNIFGLVVDRNRADVVVESGPLHYSPPPPEGELVEGGKQTFLVARQLRADSDEEEGRNKQIYLVFSLEVEDLQLEAEDYSWRRRICSWRRMNCSLRWRTSSRSALGRR